MQQESFRAGNSKQFSPAIVIQEGSCAAYLEQLFHAKE